MIGYWNYGPLHSHTYVVPKFRPHHIPGGFENRGIWRVRRDMPTGYEEIAHDFLEEQHAQTVADLLNTEYQQMAKELLHKAHLRLVA